MEFVVQINMMNERTLQKIKGSLDRQNLPVRFTCKGTGFRYDPNDIKYIGTTFSVFEFVWHFFMYTEDDKTA